MRSDTKPCIYGLHSYCIVYKHLHDAGIDIKNWGTEEWIKLHCSMCIKTIYAKSRIKTIKSFSVVNTL